MQQHAIGLDYRSISGDPRLSGVDQGQRAPGHMIKGMNPFSKRTQKSGGIRRSAAVAGLAGMILGARSCARDASAAPFYGGRGARAVRQAGRQSAGYVLVRSHEQYDLR